jgi:hypothetical protein
MALSLPHHPFSLWLNEEFIIPYGFEAMQSAADIGSYALLVSVSLAVVILHRRLKWRAVCHAGYWIITGLMMYVADRTLIVNNIERIHFPEYALMALLLGLAIRDANLVFLTASFAGFADELLQFLMNPQRTAYLDFNDIVLNILGAGFGAALLIAFRRRPVTVPASYEETVRSVLKIAAGFLGGLVLIVLFAGRFVPVVDVATDRSVIADVNGKLSFILSFERHDDFWITSDYGKVFHVLSPMEGSLLIGFLLILFLVSLRWLGGWMGRVNPSAEPQSS